MFNDLEYFIHESIGELKNQVMLRSEQFKVRIEELIDELDKYKKRCKINCDLQTAKIISHLC